VRAAVADSEFSDTRSPRRKGWRFWPLALAAGIAGLSMAAALAAYQYFTEGSQQLPVAAARTPGQVAVAAAAAAAQPPAPTLAGAPLQAQTDPTLVSPAAAGANAAEAGAADPEIAAGTPSEAEPPEGSRDAADLLEQRLLATQRWLADEQGGIFSIQLLGSNDPQMLKNYLQTLSNYIEIDKIFVYRTVANQEPSMTVLYGAFPARIDAIQSLDALPADLKSNRPYIRTVQGIRSELGLNRPS
jgi:septal ring-binding cell division protein DamX